jgi:hypothetical protein
MIGDYKKKSQSQMATLQKWKVIAFLGMLAVIPVVGQ